ncbi:hypothetical protein PFISCL1PPCAC_1381, partial [Pristionchus fissidentatus]
AKENGVEYRPHAQVESGDSGGGIVMAMLSRSYLIGVNTDALVRNHKTRGGQVHPHLEEICERTGVCPIDHF